MKAVKLRAGDPAPWFAAASSVNPAYHFDTVGGFYSVLCFFGDGGHPAGARIIGDLLAQQAFFSQRQVVFFGISTRPEDQALEKSVLDPVFCKFIRDHDGRVSALYGVLSPEGPGRVDYRPTTFIINPMMQVAAVIPVEDPARHAAAVINACLRLPPVSAHNEPAVHAPILRIPRVLTPDECGLLIRLYRQGQQRPSGFVREVDGRTVQLQDDDFKRRHDINLRDYPETQAAINQRLLKRVVPYVERAFQYRITRFERYLVARYGAERHEFFLPHRDNNSKGTAHRRFALSLNLNAGDYDGGYLRFPEFDNAAYRPAAGEAVVFSCSLLHEALPVTRGERFVLLNFFYNDDDARLRESNRQFIDLDSLQPPDDPTGPGPAAS